MHGSLIVLEGAEGVGKTTQARRLVALLEGHAIPCSHLREPGGTSLGDAIRGVLLDPFRTITPSAEALLFMASRAQLVKERVEPALKAGEVVILDRFFLSTYAYQIHAWGLAEGQVRSANQLAVDRVRPTVTAVLSLPGEEGLRRAATRAAHDRMEQLGGDFHSRVGAAFDEFVKADWQAAHPECGPIVGVDARGSEDEVFERIVDVLAPYVPQVARALGVTMQQGAAQ